MSQDVFTKSIWSYNPLTEGYTADAVFHAISGTPTISSSKLRLNQTSIVTYDRTTLFGDLEITATIPAAPTSGDSRQFGFRNNTGLHGVMVFDITDAVASAKVYDSAGTLIASKEITWNSNWTNAEARYRISWHKNRTIYFTIEDTVVAMFNADDLFDSVLGSEPMHIYVSNANNDNVDISFVSIS